MDLEIMALETAIEEALKNSTLPPQVKRLMLVELTGKMAAEAALAVRAQTQEVKKEDGAGV